MIGPAFCLIYLLTYSDTERALLGSRRRFGVNMGLSDAYQILMKNLYIFKDCGATAKEHIMEFPNRGCGLPVLNKLSKKLLETGTTAIDEAASLKAYRISLVFLFYNIRTKTGCYKKGIYH